MRRSIGTWARQRRETKRAAHAAAVGSFTPRAPTAVSRAGEPPRIVRCGHERDRRTRNDHPAPPRRATSRRSARGTVRMPPAVQGALWSGLVTFGFPRVVASTPTRHQQRPTYGDVHIWPPDLRVRCDGARSRQRHLRKDATGKRHRALSITAHECAAAGWRTMHDSGHRAVMPCARGGRQRRPLPLLPTGGLSRRAPRGRPAVR